MAKHKDQLESNIHEIVKQIRSYKLERDRFEACIDEAKEELHVLLEIYGENWTDEQGYARLISEGERTYYETDELDNLIIQDPLRYGWLKDYRVTSPIISRIQVK